MKLYVLMPYAESSISALVDDNGYDCAEKRHYY